MIDANFENIVDHRKARAVCMYSRVNAVGHISFLRQKIYQAHD